MQLRKVRKMFESYLPLAKVIKERMVKLQLTLGCAESLTCGYIQACLGSVSGASDFFAGGITAYNLEQKVGLLGVERSHASEVNCVSSKVAIEMAKGVCEKFGTDISIGTTGYAEPSIENRVDKPFAHFAIVHRNYKDKSQNDKIIEEIVYGADLSRNEMQCYVMLQALYRLADYLEKLSGS